MPSETLFAPEMERTATISECGTYRYRLGRRWASGSSLLWVMLNPSKADASIDDPTIRRVVGFSRAWGYSAATVCNLFALRATDPAELARHHAPIGPANDDYLRAAVADSGPSVVAAWGVGGGFRGQDEHACNVVRREAGWLLCLGTTKGGHPRHPLYVHGAARAEPFAGRPWGEAEEVEVRQ